MENLYYFIILLIMLYYFRKYFFNQLILIQHFLLFNEKIQYEINVIYFILFFLIYLKYKKLDNVIEASNIFLFKSYKLIFKLFYFFFYINYNGYYNPKDLLLFVIYAFLLIFN